MAQGGDTITYTHSDGTVVSEDVSGIDTAIVDYCDGSGGLNAAENPAGGGGRVENAEIDVSAIDTLYFWVGGFDSSPTHNGSTGRYGGGETGSDTGGGSTEIAQINTAQQDGSDEPFLVGAGGGGGGGGGFISVGSSGGGRDGDSGQTDGYGVAPPLGGTGGSQGEAGGDGAGAIDDQNRGLVSGGTTITGGGSPAGSQGEIQVTYESALSPPANVQITDATVEDELTLDWDEVSGAAGYYVYRDQSNIIDKGAATQVADVTTPPYTDTGLEDGERYYYRVSSHD